MPQGRYARLEGRLAEIEAQGRRRRLRPVAPISATEGWLEGGRVQLFCSNDYLGLSQHPEVIAAAAAPGAASARLIAGERPSHRALEEDLSALYGRPATVLGSGWHANLAAITTLVGRGQRVGSDALNHASIIDGMRLSGAERRILPHGQLPSGEGLDLMVVEGLYSMDGDIPDLRGLQAALGAAWLMVDEAHAFGLLGPGGRGAAAAQGVEPDVIVATLGKALGQVGGVVVGPPVLRELLLSSGRAFIFSTALPEGVVQAARVALRLADDERRGRLADRVRRLRSGLAQLGLPALGHHQIAPLVLGPQTMAVAQELLSRGYYVPGIRPPTVPLGQERLRITVCSEHSDHQIDGLLEALDQCCTSTRHS